MGDSSLIFNIFATDHASGVLGKLGGAWSKLALGVAVAGGAMAIKTTTMAADFQTGMTRLVTSAGESQANLAAVSSGTLSLMGDVGDSASALSAALYTVESGGMHGADGLVVLRAAAEGAKAEGADLVTVSDALTSVMADYHFKAKDAALVTSKMVTAVGEGKTTFQLFAGSLHSVLPLASSLHVPLDDIMGSLAAMTIHGESADQATQNMADALRHLASPTITMQKEMNQLGIDSTKLKDMLHTKGLSGTMQYLSETILHKMGPAGTVLLGVFNKSKSAAADVKKMVGSMPPDMQKLAQQFQQGKITGSDWTTALKGMPPIQANMMRQFATLEKTATGFSGALKTGSPEAQNYVAALKAVTGDATGMNVALMLTGENAGVVKDNIKKLGATTVEAGNHVKGWKEIQGTFNQQMSQAKAQIEATGIKIGTVFLPYATKMVKSVAEGVTWLTKHKGVAKDVAIVIGSLAAAVLLYKTYQLGANVVDKIGNAYQATKKVVMWGVSAATKAYAVVQAILNTNLWRWIAAQAVDFAGWVRKAAIVVWNTATLVAHQIAITAVSLATKAWAAAQWLINAAMDANPIGLIIIAIVAVVAVIVLLWMHCKPFRDFMIGMWKDIWGVLKAVGGWFAGPFTHFFVRGYQIVVDAAKLTWKWLKSIWGDIWDFIKGIGHWFSTTLPNFFKSGWNTIKGWATDFAVWIFKKIDGIVGFFKGLPSKIASAASGMWDGIKNAFKGVVNWIIGAWNSLHFTIPSIDTHIPGIGKIGGFTVSVPQLPYMAQGGIVRARPGGMLAVLGEGGRDEAVVPLNSDAGRNALGGQGGRAKERPITLCLHFDASMRALATDIGNFVRTQHGGDVQVALGGHG